jgi:FKBP-type peptidyl-prolyl cis-trans isomerase 2
VSVAEAAHRPAKSGRATALWIAFILLIAAAVGLAWIGAGSLRPTVTESGLQFRTLKTGTGEPITRADAAGLDYVVTTDDGTVVDSSQAHGGAQPFFLDMPGLYPGFAEAMTKMQEGGEYRFTMSPRLAFGSKPPPPELKGSNLTFEVRVAKIVRGGAAMMVQQMQAQQMQQMEQQQGQPEQQPQQ